MAQACAPGRGEWIHKKFAEYGIDAMEPLEVLEMLLFFSAPQSDAYALACQLMERFHGFENVMDADLAVLLDTPGISRQTAALIRLTGDMYRYVSILKANSRPMTGREQIADFLRPYFIGLNHERLYMLCMDGNDRMIGVKMISSGNFERTDASIHLIAREALRAGAVKVVIAHNHPYGRAIPSPADILATERAVNALDALNIQLRDHIIFADGEECALTAGGLLRV